MPIKPTDLCVPTSADQPFSRGGWVFELKYDGFRMLASHDGGDASLLSRNATDYTSRFPEIVAELGTLADIVLDAELVILDAKGFPRFGRLTNRSRLKRPIAIEHAAQTAPAALFAFDVLELRGRDLRGLPLTERKAILHEELARADRIRLVDYVPEKGVEFFEAAAEMALEGVVAKRADSPYRPGRSLDWVKIKTAAGRARDEERASWKPG
jgi:bifunctional non-homologous end joining protein LigD